MKFEKKFRVSSENKEVHLELPAYRKYFTDDSTYYVKLYQSNDGQLAEVSIKITDTHISYEGISVNKGFEVEFENPHRFGYGYNFYMGIEDGEIIGETEFTKVVGQVLSDVLKILGVLDEN